jgi:branched-chain amino acid transport system permease protein
MIAATAVTTALALLVGALVVRLYGIYLALLTLAFSQMVFFVVEQSRDWTNGEDGLQSIPNPLLPIGPWHIELAKSLPSINMGPFGDLRDVRVWYIFAALVLIAVLLFVRLLTRSQFGEVLTAIRENEERSIFVGFNAAAYRLAAFGIAGALAGLSGALKACYDSSIAVESVGIERSGAFVIYTVVGGVQTIFGPVVGTAVIMYLENVLSGKTEAWRLIEGLIFVFAVIFLPNGIMGTIQNRRKGRKTLARSIGIN